MSNPSRDKVEIDCNKIRALLEDGNHRTHKSIYTELNISRSVYHNRLKKIYAEDMKKITDVPQRNMSSDSTTRILDALDLVSKTTFDILANPRNRAKDRIDAGGFYLQVETMIYQQIRYGKIDWDKWDKDKEKRLG